jgi:ubiquinone/menaquinone biosynthesis C-methylase UbiE
MSGAASFYDQLAAVYDQATAGERAWTPNRVMGPFLRAAVQPGDRVLDIGTGTGQTLAALFECGVAVEAHALDISGEMLAHCRTRHGDAVRLFHGGIEEFAAAHTGPGFDILLCAGMVEFVEDLEGFLSVCRQLLRPNGTLLLTYEPVIEFHTYQHEARSAVVPGAAARAAGVTAEGFCTYRRRPDEMSRQLRRAGFEVAEEVEFIAYRKLESDIVYHLVRAGGARG